MGMNSAPLGKSLGGVALNRKLPAASVNSIQRDSGKNELGRFAVRRTTEANLRQPQSTSKPPAVSVAAVRVWCVPC